MAKYLDYEGFEYALRKLVADLDIPDVSSFITQTELNNILKDYATQSWVNEKIEGLTGGGGITSSEVQEMINESLNGYATQEWVKEQIKDLTNINLDDYVKKSELKTINGEVIYSENGGNIVTGEGGGTVDLSDYATIKYVDGLFEEIGALTEEDIDRAFEEVYGN